MRGVRTEQLVSLGQAVVHGIRGDLSAWVRRVSLFSIKGNLSWVRQFCVVLWGNFSAGVRQLCVEF